MQSGRLFNQNMVISSLTPFKQINFAPYGTDVWTEYWFPFRETNGVSNVTLVGVINVVENTSITNIKLSPLQILKDTLIIYNNTDNVLYKDEVQLKIGETIDVNLSNTSKEGFVNRIVFGDTELWSNKNLVLNRPVETVENFDWDTSYGNYLRGLDLMGLRLYQEAEGYIRKSLELNENFVPALTEMSKLHYYRMDYDSAFSIARKALSIDTYDAAANYEYGLSAIMLNKLYDALDGFEVSSLTTDFRSASYTEMSKIYFFNKEYKEALKYAEKSLVNNQYNIEGLQLLFLSNLFLGKKSELDAILNQIQKFEPLNHFCRFEHYYNLSKSESLSQFENHIRGEMPEQVYLELGIWYYKLGLLERSMEILKLSPVNAEVTYWIAFLEYKMSNSKKSFYKETLHNASLQSAEFVFPFREESKKVFEWALNYYPNWNSKYYLALLHRSRLDSKKAYNLLMNITEDVNYAPFYVFRSQLTEDPQIKVDDLKKAVSLSPNEWRYIHELTKFYVNTNENAKALRIIAPFYNNNINHFPTGLLYTRVLFRNDDYKMAEKVLDKIKILPFEGASDGQRLYRQAKLTLAADALYRNDLLIAKQKVDEARLWPRKLGVGKPYDDIIDNRIEDWLDALIAYKSRNSNQERKYLNKLIVGNKETKSLYSLFTILAMYQLGEQQKADEVFEEWQIKQDAENLSKWGSDFYNTNKNKEYPFDYDGTKRIIGLISGVSDLRLF